jgi:hypothetical protein
VSKLKMISTQRFAVRTGIGSGLFALLISLCSAVRADAPPSDPLASPEVSPVSAVVSASPSPLLAPSMLPAAWEQSFTTINADPRPPSIVRDTHYIVSNEDNHYVWRSNIENRGGVFIGVGTDQNYVMAGWARPELMVLLDFDQVVVDLHRVYRVLFLSAPTPQDFLDMWEERNVRRVEEMIEALQTDATTRAGMLRAYRTAHYSVPRRLRKIDNMYRPLGVRWFMNDLSQYRYIVEMFRTGRVIMVRGDLSVGGTLASIGAAAQKVGATVRLVYLSNAERYFPYTAGFKKSMLALPIDDRSLVLRTRARMNGSYEYIAQEAANFRRWLEWGKMSYAVEMTRYREPDAGHNLAYVIRRLPPGSIASAAPPPDTTPKSAPPPMAPPPPVLPSGGSSELRSSR